MSFVKEVYCYLHSEVNSNKRNKSKCMQLFKAKPRLLLNLPKYIRWARELIDYKAEWNGKIYGCKLTNISHKIGEKVLRNIYGHGDLDVLDNLAIGNFIIEGFYNTGWIDIKLQWRSTGDKQVNDSNMVVLTDKWCKEPPEQKTIELSGINSKMPANITRLEQSVCYKGRRGAHYPVIKRFRGEFNADTVAVRACDKLQQTGWRVDTRVLEACIDNPDKFFDPQSKEESELSKFMAYRYIIAKANIVKDDDEFFFAFDFDFRGRLYFRESFFNYQASDLAKGLLRFSGTKKMTKRGFWWLQIHCASSYNQSYSITDPTLLTYTTDYVSHLKSEELDSISVDKMTLEDRANWCNKNLALILDTANKGIIHDCEKPVCFLAACIEIRDCITAWANNREFRSSLPVPVDGSNNGWQHLGAISRDTHTGSLVGLVPSKIQNDFYVATAKEMIKLTTKDECKDVLSQMPMKHIRKGISKRGSMTRAYSAGAPTIAENMYDDCKQAKFNVAYGITPELCLAFSNTLVKAIDHVCPGPLKTMKFLQESMSQRLEQGYTFVEWTSPSGFPVIFECNQTRTYKVQNRIQGLPTARCAIKQVLQVQQPGKPDVRGFASGISPNFVHSQDAAHMHLVIDNFDGAFGAVHDSFSTYASDIDTLLACTKSVFVNMYNYDNYFNIISNLFGTNASQPEIGNLDLEGIINSDYFFA